jgi:hypothetical protein
MGKRIPFGSYAESQGRRAIIRGGQSNVRCSARKCIGCTSIPSVR